MELRVLKYFLAVAREQNITNASEILHITQPTLSRQLKELEDELGIQLLIRGNKSVSLTEDGMLFRKRAEEIVELADKTIIDMNHAKEDITGDIYIGSGETNGARIVISIMKELNNKYPNIRFHINSGDKQDILEKLDKGLIDFGIFLDPIDKSKYNYLKIPASDTFGILARKDSILADKKYVTNKDLIDKPLIISRQTNEDSGIMRWLNTTPDKLNIVATYNLAFNASLMVDEGLGYALTLDKIINTSGNSNLCFIPLKPDIKVEMFILWKKYQMFNKAGDKFLEDLENKLNEKKG